MQEARGAHPAVLQPPQRAGPEISDADAVQQHPHLHPARLGGDQGIAEVAAGVVVAEDIAGQRNAFRSARNRLQHGRIGFVAGFENGDAVARAQRARRDALADRGQRRDMGRNRRPSRGRLIGPARLATARELRSAPAHAINAEDVIDEPAEKGRQPRQPDPAQGRGNGAAPQQHMHRHRAGHQHIGREFQRLRPVRMPVDRKGGEHGAAPRTLEFQAIWPK